MIWIIKGLGDDYIFTDEQLAKDAFEAAFQDEIMHQNDYGSAAPVLVDSHTFTWQTEFYTGTASLISKPVNQNVRKFKESTF